MVAGAALWATLESLVVELVSAMLAAPPVRIRRAAFMVAFCKVNCEKNMVPVSMMPNINAKKMGAMKANSMAAEPRIFPDQRPRKLEPGILRIIRIR